MSYTYIILGIFPWKKQVAFAWIPSVMGRSLPNKWWAYLNELLRISVKLFFQEGVIYFQMDSYYQLLFLQLQN